MGKTHHSVHCPLSGNPKLLEYELTPDHQGRKLRIKTRKDGEKGRNMAVKSISSEGDFILNYIPLSK